MPPCIVICRKQLRKFGENLHYKRPPTIKVGGLLWQLVNYTIKCNTLGK